MATFDETIYDLRNIRLDWEDDKWDREIYLCWEYLLRYLQDGVWNHKWNTYSQINHLYKTGNTWTPKQRWFMYKHLLASEHLIDPMKAYA